MFQKMFKFKCLDDFEMGRCGTNEFVNKDGLCQACPQFRMRSSFSKYECSLPVCKLGETFMDPESPQMEAGWRVKLRTRDETP